MRVQTEEQLQREVLQALRLCGVTVLQTSEHRRRGDAGFGRGCDKGVPDLLVRAPHWRPAVWMGIELKRAVGGRLSPAQKQLVSEGAVIVAHSLREVTLAILTQWDTLAVTCNPASRAMENRVRQMMAYGTAVVWF